MRTRWTTLLKKTLSAKFVTRFLTKKCNFRKWKFTRVFLRRGAPFLNSYVLCPLSVRFCLSHFCFYYGKTLPLFLSDIFSQIFSKCRIFPDIVSERDIFIFSYLWFWATYFHKWSINDPQWSIIFQLIIFSGGRGESV